MQQRIAHIALMVKEYDEAIKFYTEKVGFKLICDIALNEKKRWVLLAPQGTNECGLLLAKADADKQIDRIGDQTDGRVFLFLYTDNFWRDYNNMLAKGISFIRKPVVEDYGTVAVFSDLYGNLWDLIEPNN